MSIPPNFPSSLQTGNNEAIQKNLLVKIVKYLVNQYHYKVLKSLVDLTRRVFAYALRDAYGQRFYLVAKGGFLMGDIVSCQAGLPNLGVQEHSPIVLGWWNPDRKELKFYLFDPAGILQLVKDHPEKYGYDDRFDVRMINFSTTLSRALDPAMSVEAVWKKTRDPQTKLG